MLRAFDCEPEDVHFVDGDQQQTHEFAVLLVEDVQVLRRRKRVHVVRIARKLGVYHLLVFALVALVLLQDLVCLQIHQVH